MRLVLVVVMLVIGAGCDSRATASDPAGGGARAEQKSKELESCGASMHCQDDLRCLQQVCRRVARSVVGDYYATVGAQAHARGDHEAAIAAYAQALAQYEAEKVPNGPPPDVDCGYGAALAGAKGKKDHLERGARVLHRCVLAVPAGSALREQALAQLATLGDAGLDPLLLGSAKLADLYLTKGPVRPSTDKLGVTVTAAPQPTGKSFPLVPEKLTGPEIRSALVACWEAYNAATRKDALAVVVGLKVAFVANPDYEEEGSYVIKLDQGGGGGGAEAAAEACVRQTIEPALKSLKLTDYISTKLTITIR